MSEAFPEYVARILASDGTTWRIATACPIGVGEGGETLFLTTRHQVFDGSFAATEFELQVGEQTLDRHTLRWESPSLDLVVIGCRTPRPIKIPPIGAIAESTSKYWTGGFPRAGKEGQMRRFVEFVGRLYAGDSRHASVELGVEDPPGDVEEWSGASGSPVFVDGRLVAVVRAVPDSFAGRRVEAVAILRAITADPTFPVAMRGDDAMAAFDALIESGMAAEKRGDLASAANFYVAAMSAAIDRTREVSALLRAARVELQRYDFATATRYLAQARGLALAAPDIETEIAVIDARRLRFAGDDQAARAVLATASAQTTPQLTAELAFERATLEPDDTLRRQGFHDAIRLYAQAGDQHAAARARLALGDSELRANKLPDAELHFRQALDEFERLADAHGIALARSSLARYLRSVDRNAESQRAALDALALSQRHHFDVLALSVRFELAAVETRLGQLSSAEQQVNSILSCKPAAMLAAHCVMQLGAIACEREAHEVACYQLHKARKHYQALRADTDARHCQLHLVELELEATANAAASRQHLDAAPGTSSGRLAAFEALLRARIAIASGDVTSGTQQLVVLQQHALRSIAVAAYYHHARALAEAGESTAALRLAAEGKRIAHESDELVWTWRFDELEAKISLALGRRDDALAAASRARDGYRSVDNKPGQMRCEVLLTRRPPHLGLWVLFIAAGLTGSLALVTYGTSPRASVVVVHKDASVEAQQSPSAPDASAPFVAWIRTRGPDGTACTEGSVSLTLNGVPHTMSLTHGEALFPDIPSSLEGTWVPATVICKNLQGQKTKVSLQRDRPFDIRMSRPLMRSGPCTKGPGEPAPENIAEMARPECQKLDRINDTDLFKAVQKTESEKKNYLCDTVYVCKH